MRMRCMRNSAAWASAAVVVASGGENLPRLPQLARALPGRVAQAAEVQPGRRVRAVRLDRAVEAAVGRPGRPVLGPEVGQPAEARHPPDRPPDHVLEPVQVVAGLGHQHEGGPAFIAPVAADEVAEPGEVLRRPGAVEAEVVDLRSLVPLDRATVLSSVAKTTSTS